MGATNQGSERRRDSEAQWHAAERRHLPVPVDVIVLDPDKAVERVTYPPGSDNPVFVIEQKRRPPLVITKDTLHVPCACGSHLHAVTSELYLEGWQAGVHYKGLCFRCGWQEAIYVVAHQQPTEEQIAMAEEVYELRRSA